jgi:branched-chain amino acid transport system substrate-binding protein
LFFCAFAGPYLGLFENTNKLQAAETIKIAAILPLTGKAATYGRAALEGVEVAVDSLNGAGGLLDRSLELIVIDNTSTPLGSRQAAKKAVGLNVSAVIGAVWSTHSLAMAPVLQEAGIPMISPGSTAPQVTHAGSYIFRTCYTDSFQGRLLAGFAYHELQARTAAILTNLNETYSQELSSQFDSAFRQIGGKVVMADGYKGSAVDFKTMLQSVKARSPDVVFIPGYSKDSGFIIRQAHAMKLRALFLGGDAWETDIAEFAGPRLEGSYFSTFWHPNLSSPESRHFTTTFHAYHGKREISPYAALAYDAVYLFAHAVDHAGSLKRQDIREELQGTKGFNGATGAFTFDEFGDPLDKGAAILKFVKGQWVLYKWVGPTAWQTNMVR